MLTRGEHARENRVQAAATVDGDAVATARTACMARKRCCVAMNRISLHTCLRGLFVYVHERKA
eukprot:m.128931 g.128931  ORF g.128931 m.128931 type:complete len:63 (+) comp13881_c0_seq2:3918-4106(+)